MSNLYAKPGMDRNLDNILKSHYNLRKQISSKSIAASWCQVFFQVVKTFRTLSKMDFDQLRRSSGFNLERIKNTKILKGNPMFEILLKKSMIKLTPWNGIWKQVPGIFIEHYN